MARERRTMVSSLQISLLFGLVGFSASVTFTTSGEGGETCGPAGEQCLSDLAVCDTGTQQCDCNVGRFTEGSGLLNCYRPSEYYTEIVNDPTFITFNENAVDFSLPCRFMMTHFSTAMKGKNNADVGRCTFEVIGFQEKDIGKMYVAGFDVAFSLDYDSGTSYGASIRTYGTADNGTYTYTTMANDGQFQPDGPWNDDVILDYNDRVNKVKVIYRADDVNNLAIFYIKKCGVRMRMRGYDTALRRNSTQTPGISIVISEANEPVTFLSDNAVLAMVPIDVSNGFTLEMRLVGLLDRRQTMVYRALTSGVAQNKPDPNPECSAAAGFLSTCNTDIELKEAFDNCLWMFKAPRFIRCFDNSTSGEGLMGLFNSCTSIFCGATRGYATCTNVIASITDAGCGTVEGYTMLDKFLDESICPGNGAAQDRRRRRRRRSVWNARKFLGGSR